MPEKMGCSQNIIIRNLGISTTSQKIVAGFYRQLAPENFFLSRVLQFERKSFPDPSINTPKASSQT